MEENKKPPIGLKPKKIYDQEVHKRRADEITEVMIRYSEANMVIPTEWIEELEFRIMKISTI